MKNGIILIVDDEPGNRALIRRVLAPTGVQLLEASDGREALERIAGTLPDLVLLDIQMPHMDGYDLLRELKGSPRTRLVPVVMLTSIDEFQSKLSAIDLGADDYLMKPFNPAELTSRVRSLLSLKRFTDELEHASGVVQAIARVVESRDQYTGDHCRRLADLSERVGSSLGVKDEDLQILRLGGVLHDLGKVSVSDTILNKPGRLTPDEIAIMKQHPLTGFGLCKEMRTLDRVLPLIRHHHEKLDGSGYPDGLKGGEISLPVRITSVVDVYDALATRRSYKEPMPTARCLEILREEAAKGWWDREVVEALARLVTSP
jgi:putative two-component system response regulator